MDLFQPCFSCCIRLREPNWVVVFKSLILVHILMREGATDRVLGYLVNQPNIINTSGFRDKSLNPLSVAQSKNIRSYSEYLEEKVAGYKTVKDDFVRSKPEYIAKFRSMSQDSLLKEVQVLQRQIDGLLGCSFYLEEIDNVVTLQSFRLLVGDMMSLFHLMNEGVIRILGCYFDMEKSEAQRALQIYKNFAQQTTKTVEFFDIARKLRNSLGIDIPSFKHAPISLVSALEDYIKAPDFEAQRKAYRDKKSQANGHKDFKDSYMSVSAKEEEPKPKAVAESSRMNFNTEPAKNKKPAE
ncbi:ANTH domain-containing protein, partial [Chytridium lagenaria]